MRFDSAIKQMREFTENKFEMIEKKLHIIAEGFSKVENKKAEEEAEDRKRLKERLKEALDEGKQILRMSTGLQYEGWFEYFFGICNPDGRIGKAGSRFAPRQKFPSLRISNLDFSQAYSPAISLHTRYDT